MHGSLLTDDLGQGLYFRGVFEFKKFRIADAAKVRRFQLNWFLHD
jgi:hypothetical protein